MDGTTVFPVAADADEVPFGIEEMFYSRTDARGVIVAGNQVFQRVSCHPWQRLIGAPHRIIRNQATPKAVFRIMWTTIQSGRPAVAYVCNRAADGRPYWVMATVLPFRGGYLSIRIKPSSPLLSEIKALYSRLSSAEADGHSIEDSVLSLQHELGNRGFSSYEDFMCRALREEFVRRTQATSSPSPLPERVISSIQTIFREALESQSALQTEFKWMQVLPTNLSLLAHRLEPEGGPMSAVAELYKAGTEEALSWIGAFTSGSASLCSRMCERFEWAVFMVTCAMLQRELGRRVAHEDWSGSGIDPGVERQFVDDISRQYCAAADASVEEALELARVIEKAGEKLRRSMMSLETIITMGKVEGARFGQHSESIHTIIASLHDLNTKISSVMARIVNLSTVICRGMEDISCGFQTGS